MADKKLFAIAYGPMEGGALEITFHPGDTWTDAVKHFADQQPAEIKDWLLEELHKAADGSIETPVDPENFEALGLPDLVDFNPVKDPQATLSCSFYCMDCKFAIAEVPDHG